MAPSSAWTPPLRVRDTVSSLSDVSAAVKCTTVNIEAFTVPAGETFNLELASNTVVNMRTSPPSSPLKDEKGQRES